MQTLNEYARRGPHPVGVQSVEIADPADENRRLPVDLWYPAVDGVDDSDAAKWADHPLGQPHRAVGDAHPRAGIWPLIVFSHGNSGMRRQSTFLTTHLASWGFVVGAPDHLGNTFADMQGLEDAPRKEAHLAARRNRPRDLVSVIDGIARLTEPAPRVRAEGIGALGHSFGGWTAFKMPRIDPRIAAVCGLAPASEPFVGRKAFEADELPLARLTPSLTIAGSDDLLVDFEDSIEPLYSRLAAPRQLIAIDGADHFHFCDGIPVLQAVHQFTARSGLKRPVRPYAELLAEEATHRLLCGLVTHFFEATLRRGIDPGPHYAAESLASLDPSLRSIL